MNFARWIYILVLMIGPAAAQAQSATLSKEAIFRRCYSQMTRNARISPTDPTLIAVKAGTKDPVVACMEIFDRALLVGGGNTTVANTADPVAKAIIGNFHKLHSSWFEQKEYPVHGNVFAEERTALFDFYDTSSPALYFTRALFHPSLPAQSVVTSPEYIRPVRTTPNPTTGPYTQFTQLQYIMDAAVPFAATGELLGAAPAVNLLRTYNITQGGATVAKTVDFGVTLGGGLLGTVPYVQQNLGSAYYGYRGLGAVTLQRRYGRAVYADTLCRELPLVREADVVQFVVPTAQAPFRKTASCTKCHASMDRTAGVIRNLNLIRTGGEKYNEEWGPTLHEWTPATLPAETSWTSSNDGNYWKRTPTGTLFFRNYKGVLVDEAVQNMADLGAKIAAQDDYYICIAKRYYKYFTGINVKNGDITDPNFGAYTTADLKHRDQVIALGLALKSHQKMRLLVESILKLPHYQKTDFGVSDP